MSIGLGLALLLSTLGGVLCVTPLWKPGHSPIPQAAMLGSLAVGLGVGLSTCVGFVVVMLFGAALARLIFADVAFLLMLGGLLLLFRRPAQGATAVRHPRLRWDPRPQWLLGVGLAISVGCTAITFAALSFRSPHGAWDAWAIWNLRARFVFGDGADWLATFSQVMPSTHPDYPLLLPLAVARIWYFTGASTLAAPAVVAALFTFATVALICSSVAFLRTPLQGLLAGLLFLALPAFASQGSSQYADIPLGFFLLASVSLLCVSDRSGEDARAPLVLAGLATGLAAWTKNEGLLLVVTILSARCAALIYGKSRTAWLRELPVFAAGLVPVLLVVFAFKLLIAPPNDLIAGQGVGATFERLSSGGRYLEVVRGFRDAIGDVTLTAFVNPAWILALYLALVGIDAPQVKRSGFSTALLALALIVIGYVLVYITTPRELSWHLRYSADRLLLQVWPVAVFLGFVAARAPEELTS